MKPVSKKNNASWNRISQENALDVSSKMYEDSTSVTSSLVDSFAWDTVVEWIKSRGESVTNSTSYGNYVNSTFSLSNVLYAVHEYKYTNWTWKSCASKYMLGNLEITSRSLSGEQTVYELATGTTTETMRNNIYDMAGNMWEWTTETGKHGNSASTTTWAVFRGGSFATGLAIPFLTATVTLGLLGEVTLASGSVSCFTSNSSTEFCNFSIVFLNSYQC